MSEPIVFISRNRVKQGMYENLKQHYLESVPRTESSKPNTLAQLTYLNLDDSDLTIIRIFPSAKSLDQQLQGADDRSKTTYQFIEPTSIEIYGKPNDYALEMMNKVAGSGIPEQIHPHYLGGFMHLRPR